MFDYRIEYNFLLAKVECKVSKYSCEKHTEDKSHKEEQNLRVENDKSVHSHPV